MIRKKTWTKGKTILTNCAIEPEVLDLVSFLKKLGCKIHTIGRKITVEGAKKINDKIKHKVIFDRIEAGTYLIAGALTGKKLVINNIYFSLKFHMIHPRIQFFPWQP